MKILFTILIAALSVVYSYGQNSYEGNLSFKCTAIEKENDLLKIDLLIDVSAITLPTQQMVVLTPVLTSADSLHIRTFKPVWVLGKRREKALNREIGFGSFHPDPQPYTITRREGKSSQVIPVPLEVSYESWMRDAKLSVKEEVSGCANCDIAQNLFNVVSPLLPPLIVPSYEVAYITPPVEEVKERSETHTARLNFEVARYELLRNYKNNASVLEQVDQIVSEVKNDPNLTITEFKVTGYASPEGNFNSNMKLSENRARSFVNYLKDRYGLQNTPMQVDWKGEDWDGLRQEVKDSYIQDKDRILEIIDNNRDIAQRKSKLQSLSGGSTYRTLLQDFYPPLRRNEYTIAYIARSFDVEEAKILIRTKPQYLSLNEMFLVANTYPKDSKEFKEIFDIASRMYPDSQIALMNTAALDLENGAVDAAIERMKNINLPEAWNNLGVAYIKKGDYEKASGFFTKASQAGNRQAAENMRQLDEWLKNQ